MEWISVNDDLPEMKPLYADGPKKARVLVFTGHYVTEGALEETFVKRIPTWKDAAGRGIRVTHWMPFPAPPEPAQ